jgi:hypothetical protein
MYIQEVKVLVTANQDTLEIHAKKWQGFDYDAINDSAILLV